MAEQTLYEVLEVTDRVSQAEIRRAYLHQARRHHPDHHRAEGPAAAAAAEDRMRLVNEAWTVLGDPLRRRDYDHRLAAAAAAARIEAAAARASRPPIVTRPSEHFEPLRPDTPEDPDEDDSWRYLPDEGDPATAPPRVLLAAPPVAFLAGVAALLAGFLLGGRAWSTAGIVLLFASALLFVGAPVVALFRSQMGEERARRRRG